MLKVCRVMPMRFSPFVFAEINKLQGNNPLGRRAAALAEAALNRAIEGATGAAHNEN